MEYIANHYGYHCPGLDGSSRLARFILLMLLLAGCSPTPAPSCLPGPLHALNAGQWQPTQADLTP